MKIILTLTFSWQRPYHIGTSPLICSANQWTGFYMITASVMKELIPKNLFCPFIWTKNKNQFLRRRWSGNESFIFIPSSALLQKHAEYNELLWKNFLTWNSCSFIVLCWLIFINKSSNSWIDLLQNWNFQVSKPWKTFKSWFH